MEGVEEKTSLELSLSEIIDEKMTISSSDVQSEKEQREHPSEDEKDWSKLPTLALRKIYKLLDPADIVSAGQMCRQWRSVAVEEHFWKDLDLHDKDYLPENQYNFLRVLRFAPCLTWLRLDSSLVRSGRITDYFREELTLINCRIRRLDHLFCIARPQWAVLVLSALGPHLEWLLLLHADHAVLRALAGLFLTLEGPLGAGLQLPADWQPPPVQHLSLDGSPEDALLPLLLALGPTLRTLSLQYKSLDEHLQPLLSRYLRYFREAGWTFQRDRGGWCPPPDIDLQDQEVPWPRMLLLLDQCDLPRLKQLLLSYRHRLGPGDTSCLDHRREARRILGDRVYVRCLRCAPDH